MENDLISWVSILPPVLAIVLAIWTRQVFVSLLAGIYLGWVIVNRWDFLAGLSGGIEGMVMVFSDGGNTKVILFCGLVGGLMALMRESGGVDGFVGSVSRRGWLKNRRRPQFLSALIGISIFVETTISSLVVGTISRPIFDRARISREKLAFICDSTCAPVNLLIPLNAWGAFIIGLLAKENIDAPVDVLISSIVFNFYPLAALLMVFAVIFWGKDFGPMKKAEQNAMEREALDQDDSVREGMKPAGKTTNMIVPLGIMILMMPVGLAITGKGDLAAGSGSTAVLWSVLAAVFAAVVLYRVRGIMTVNRAVEITLKGIGEMVPLVVLMILAFAIGDVARELKTGIFVASLAERFLTPVLVPVILFLASCFISFSTGTSWGTFAIMVPIAVPMAGGGGPGLPLMVAAVLGGGLFGDHCSPISDTTIVASMASSCDHIAHVRTQLPYALTAASAASVLYILAALVVM